MAILDSIKKFVFPAVDEGDDFQEVEKKPQVKPLREESFSQGAVKRNKVVTLPTGGEKKIVVIKLDSTAGVKSILNHLKERTPVVLNIARLDRSDAVRVVDIVYGASFALDGNMQKVSTDIFVATPQGMEITGDITAELLGAEEFSLEF